MFNSREKDKSEMSRQEADQAILKHPFLKIILSDFTKGSFGVEFRNGRKTFSAEMVDRLMNSGIEDRFLDSEKRLTVTKKEGSNARWPRNNSTQ